MNTATLRLPAPAPELDVVTLGEIMAMFVADAPGALASAEHFTRRLAGAEFNVAVGLTRLGHRVGFLTRLGADPFGEFAQARLRQLGIDDGQVSVDATAPTGFQLKNRTGDGDDPTVVYFRAHSAARGMGPTTATDAYLRRARHLHLTGIPLALGEGPRALAAQAVAAARQSGATVSVDPNLRPALWPDTATMVRTVNDLALQADWVLPGLPEGRILTGATTPAGVARWYLDRGVRTVAVKTGAAGAELFTHDGQHVLCPPFPVRPVDTVGAGDGFAAGFISAALDGRPAPEWLSRAAAVGAIATTSHGDQEGLPDRAGLDAFLAATDQTRIHDTTPAERASV